jgi:hypothetical protein
LFAACLKLFSGNLIFSASDIFIGFLILISICSLNAWFLDLRNSLIIIFEILIFVSLFLYCFFKSNNKTIKFTVGAKVTVITSFMTSTILTISGIKNRIYYVNPDPFGYMSLSGGLKKYGNFPSIMSEWTKFTGNKFKFDSNWNIPTQLLDRSWLVPDMQIRYAADALNFPRVGFSSLAASIPNKFYSMEVISILFLAAALFSCAALIGSLVEIISGYRLNFRENRNDLKFSPLIQISVFLVSIFFVAPWVQVLIFESFTAHLITFTCTVVIFNLIVNEQILIKNRINKKLVINLLLIIIASYFVYLQQVSIILFCMSILFIFNFASEKFHNKLFYLFFLLIIGTAILLSLNLPGNKYLIGKISNSNAHGSVHLGSPGILELMGLNNNFFGSQISNTNPVKSQIFINTLNTNAAIDTTQIGYIQFSTSMISIWIQFIILIILMVLFILKLKKLKIISPFLIPTALIVGVFSLYSAYYIFTHVYKVFDAYRSNEKFDAIFSDYIWLRLLSVVAVLFLIFLALAFKSITLNQRFFKSKFIILTNLLIFILSISSLVSSASQYEKKGTPGVVGNCDYFNKIINPVFIWNDTPANQSTISLASCGFSFYSLTDSFPGVKIPVSSMPYTVVYLKYSVDQKVWGGQVVGTLLSTGDLVTPCDLNCLDQQIGFNKFNSPTVIF